MPISLLEKQRPRIQDFQIPERVPDGPLTLQNVFDPKRDITEDHWKTILEEIQGEYLTKRQSATMALQFIDPSKMSLIRFPTDHKRYTPDTTDPNLKSIRVSPDIHIGSIIQNLADLKVLLPQTFKKLNFFGTHSFWILKSLESLSEVQRFYYPNYMILASELEQLGFHLSELKLKIDENEVGALVEYINTFREEDVISEVLNVSSELDYLANVKLVTPGKLANFKPSQDFLRHISFLLTGSDVKFDTEWLLSVADLRILQASTIITDGRGHHLTFPDSSPVIPNQPLPVMRSF